MLNRQKTILYMLQAAGRSLSRMEVTKWCFLLGEETRSGGGKSFYQFVPYHYGPFSFCLYREADALVRDELLKEPDEKSWELTSQSRAGVRNLSAEVKNDVATIVRRFGHRPIEETRRYVYQRFPWFTVNSKRERRMHRPVASPAVYTAGYEGLLIDGFLDMLLRHGMERLIDVRANPVARRYGFHGSTLDRLCCALGMEYVHVPELGVPSECRRGLKTRADYEHLLRRYEAETLGSATESLARVASLMATKPSVLVCLEADPTRCHRTRLAGAVAARTGLTVVHVEPAA